MRRAVKPNTHLGCASHGRSARWQLQFCFVRRAVKPAAVVLGLWAAFCVAGRVLAQDAGPARGPANDAAAAPKGQAAAGAKPDVNALSPAERLAALRKKVLREDDFKQNEELNRDPFHSFLKFFGEKAVTIPKGVGPPAVFEKFALEELVLIAVISGDANPRAMFRDPTGVGQTIKKGDYISKVRSRVTKILSDRIVVETVEDKGTGEPTVLERAILVNPEEAQ